MRNSRALLALMVAVALTATLSPASAHRQRYGSSISFGFNGDTDGGTFRGKVNAAFDACQRGRRVKVFRVVADAPDVLTTSAKSNVLGTWYVTHDGPAAGTYYAVATRKVIRRTGHRHICKPVRSRTDTVGAPTG